MRRCLSLTLLLVAAAAVAWADISPVLFQGTFSADDQAQLFSLTVDGASPVIIQSYGYAGGTFGATTVTPGGFSPNAILFDNTGAEVASASGGHCGITAFDPVTGECNDPYLSQPSLAAGTYTLALVEYDNQPNDSLLADGFKQDGNPGFTCAEFGLTGNFCDVTTALGTQRTGDWAIAFSGITAVSEVTTPEPAYLLMLGSGLAGLLLLRRQVG